MELYVLAEMILEMKVCLIKAMADFVASSCLF